MSVIQGQGPSPALVLRYIERLPDTSFTVALATGGREHLGWGVDRHMNADLYDLTVQVLRAAGNWGKKGPPKIPAYPRPSTKPRDDSPKKRASVKDLHARMSRR